MVMNKGNGHREAHNNIFEERDIRPNILGFEIYDYLHIAVAAIILIIIALDKFFFKTGFESEEISKRTIDAAELFVELFMSVLLIFYIKYIYETKTRKTMHTYYGLAWVIVTMGLLIPECFNITTIIYVTGLSYEPIHVLERLSIYLTIIAFAGFLSMMYLRKNSEAWLYVLRISVSVLLVYSLVASAALTLEIIEETPESWEHWVYCVAEYLLKLSPLIPGIIGLTSLQLIPNEAAGQ